MDWSPCTNKPKNDKWMNIGPMAHGHRSITQSIISPNQ